MKAVVIYGKEDFRYQEVEAPKAGRQEVVVKVARCGICAVDPKILHGKGYVPPLVAKHVPIIAGHEFIGEVVELGEGAKEKYGLEIGDKAIAEQIVPCWKCHYCQMGLYHMCDVHKIFGISGPDGGWAEYMKYPQGSIIWKVPEDMPYEVAIAIEPLACATHGVERANIQFGDTVVVIGGGAIGLFMLQVAKLKNPKMLSMSDLLEDRLSLAKELGADVVVNPAKDDVVKKVKNLTDGLGCEIVLEASGSPVAVEQAIEMLRRRGKLMEFGVFAEKVCIDFSIIGDIKELEIIGGHLAFHTYPLAIKYLSEGLVKTDKIVTHNLPLKKWREALGTAEKRKGGAIKVTMTPGA